MHSVLGLRHVQQRLPSVRHHLRQLHRVHVRADHHICLYRIPSQSLLPAVKLYIELVQIVRVPLDYRGCQIGEPGRTTDQQ